MRGIIMTLNKTIREYRLAKKLTQEQVATYLGVTTPAVNKWEKGISYPDITLLPALARLLDTDVNTLLSFKELTETEIPLILNDLSKLAETNGFEAMYTAAMQKIKEYPTCYPLILNIATLLDGAVVLYRTKQEDITNYRTEIETLYQRVLASQDSYIKSQAQTMLISRYIERKEYDKAQELLNILPDKVPVDKKQIQINLLIACGKLEEAAKLEEEKLFATTTNIQNILLTLLDIALKENRLEDATYIADVSKKNAITFNLWEYNTYIAYFQLYSARKDRTKCLEVLTSMLQTSTCNWNINESPLYRHVKTKEIGKGFSSLMKQSIIQSICQDENMAFLYESKDFQSLLKELKIG